jgi:hypothetical protein
MRLVLESGKKVEEAVVLWILTPLLVSKAKEESDECVVAHRLIQAFRHAKAETSKPTQLSFCQSIAV